MSWQDMQEPAQPSREEAETQAKLRAQENALEIETEGEEDTSPAQDPTPKTAADDSNIEIVDDTPEADRNRKPVRKQPEDPTPEELEKYNERARKRIQHFAHSLHDERRAKEEALRERMAAEEFAQAQLRRAQDLERKLAELQTTAHTATKSQLEVELAQARKEYREAYEAGDADALEKANDRVIDLRMRISTLAEPKPAQVVEEKPLQPERDVVNNTQTADVPTVQPDPKAIAWHAENPWFGADKRMTDFVQGLHIDLVTRQRVDPTSDDYYRIINESMRRAFPDYDWDDEDSTVVNPDPAEPRRAEKRPATVVAGASRDTPVRKIKLTKSQVNIASRLGIPLEEYARQVVELNRNGGR